MFIVKLTYFDSNDILRKNEFFSGFGGAFVTKYEISEPVIETAVNSVGHFSFTVYPSHPLYEFVDKPKSVIEVVKHVREQPLFVGRLSECSIGLYNEKKLVFESELAFLLDSVRTDFNSVAGHSAKYWFENILNYHNNHAGNFGSVYTDNIQRKFTVGNVSREILTQFVDIPAEKFKGTYTTLDIIRMLLLDKCGGVLKIRHQDNINYIDWLCEDDLHICTQKIELAKNLLDIENNYETAEIVSAIRPVGENVTLENGLSVPLDITLFDASVYISDEDIYQVIDSTATEASDLKYTDTMYSKKLVDKYGWIQKEVFFSGAVNKSSLVKKAENYLRSVGVKNCITIKAVDLSGIDSSIEDFEVGDLVWFNSSAHFLVERKMMINSVLLNLSDISESEIIVGIDDRGIVSQISDGGSSASGSRYSGGGYRKYDTEGSAQAALNEAKKYTDSVVGNKVDKEDGKGLSTNDFTDSFKSQIETNTVRVNTLVLSDNEQKNTITKLNEYIAINTGDISALDNRLTDNETSVNEALSRNEFTDEEKAKLAGITNPMVIKGRVDTTDDLPSTAEIGWFYFVGKENAEYYEEYCYSENGWEYVGLSQEGVDLSDYYTKSGTDSVISEKLSAFEGVKLKPVETKVDRNTQLIANNSGSISALDTRVNENTANIGKHTNEISVLNSNVSSLQSGLSATVSRVADVESEVDVLNSSVEYLSEHKANTTTVTANTNAISALDTRLTSSESKITALQLTDSQHSDQITKNALNIANNSGKIETNTSNIAINKTTLGYQKKNLLKNTGTTQTINGVTFTINEDKTVTANGTATDNATLHLSDSVKLNVGTKYILSGCPEGGGLSTYRLYGLSNGYGWYDNGSDEGESKKFTATESKSYTYRIAIYSGTTVNNLVFKPMIRLADITDDTYEPYVDDVDTRLNKFTSQKQLYSNTTGGSSPLTLTVSGLFEKYSAVICNIVTSNGKYNLTLPLQYIKSLGTSAYYEAEGLLFYYVDDSNITVRTGLGQSNPTISSIKIIGLY